MNTKPSRKNEVNVPVRRGGRNNFYYLSRNLQKTLHFAQ